jgi:hypothetical protein
LAENPIREGIMKGGIYRIDFLMFNKLGSITCFSPGIE